MTLEVPRHADLFPPPPRHGSWPWPEVSTRTTPTPAATPGLGADKGIRAPSNVLFPAPQPPGAVERAVKNFVAGPHFENRALGTGAIFARVHDFGSTIGLQGQHHAPPPRPPLVVWRTGRELRMAQSVAPPPLAVPTDALPSVGHRTKIAGAEGAGAAPVVGDPCDRLDSREGLQRAACLLTPACRPRPPSACLCTSKNSEPESQPTRPSSVSCDSTISSPRPSAPHNLNEASPLQRRNPRRDLTPAIWGQLHRVVAGERPKSGAGLV